MLGLVVIVRTYDIKYYDFRIMVHRGSVEIIFIGGIVIKTTYNIIICTYRLVLYINRHTRSRCDAYT